MAVLFPFFLLLVQVFASSNRVPFKFDPPTFSYGGVGAASCDQHFDPMEEVEYHLPPPTTTAFTTTPSVHSLEQTVRKHVERVMIMRNDLEALVRNIKMTCTLDPQLHASVELADRLLDDSSLVLSKAGTPTSSVEQLESLRDVLSSLVEQLSVSINALHRKRAAQVDSQMPMNFDFGLGPSSAGGQSGLTTKQRGSVPQFSSYFAQAPLFDHQNQPHFSQASLFDHQNQPHFSQASLFDHQNQLQVPKTPASRSKRTQKGESSRPTPQVAEVIEFDVGTYTVIEPEDPDVLGDLVEMFGTLTPFTCDEEEEP